MIRSMTGYGAAEHADDTVRIAVEIRTVNNRFYKANLHLPEGLGAVEAAIDKVLRESISRGTVNLTVYVEPRGAAVRVPINRQVLEAYLNDLEKFRGALSTRNANYYDALVGFVLGLPGVVGGEEMLLTGVPDLAARIQAAVREAVQRLDAMRLAEGRAIQADMQACLDQVQRLCAAIEARVPAVVEEYHGRLRRRVSELLQGAQVAVDDQTLAREVAFAAERSDINEELARLRSHLDQFREFLAEPGPAGRKLEFITQEMAREVNTMGAKSADAELARLVVALKVSVDRLREQSQNVE